MTKNPNVNNPFLLILIFIFAGLSLTCYIIEGRPIVGVLMTIPLVLTTLWICAKGR